MSTTTEQLTLDFEPGLTERYPTLLACIIAAAHSNRKPLKTLAADMDMSQSELSRRLHQNPGDARKFSVDDLEAFIAASGDLTPIYYLVEKHLASESDRQRRAIAELSKALPQIAALIKAAG